MRFSNGSGVWPPIKWVKMYPLVVYYWQNVWFLTDLVSLCGSISEKICTFAYANSYVYFILTVVTSNRWDVKRTDFTILIDVNVVFLVVTMAWNYTVFSGSVHEFTHLIRSVYPDQLTVFTHSVAWTWTKFEIHWNQTENDDSWRVQISAGYFRNPCLGLFLVFIWSDQNSFGAVFPPWPDDSYIQLEWSGRTPEGTKQTLTTSFLFYAM